MVAIQRANWGDRTNNVVSMPRSSRVPRRFGSRHNIISEAFELNPFFCRPVLPNDTLTNISFTTRKISDALNSPIMGVNNEVYFFYVPWTALTAFDSNFAESLLTDPDASWTSVLAGADSDIYYTQQNAVKYVETAYKVVAEHWFREESEAWDDYEIRTGLSAVAVSEEWWWDKVKDWTTVSDADDPTLLDAATTDTLEVSEVSDALTRYRLETAYNMVDMSFDDWLRANGVRRRTTQQDPTLPELLLYETEWRYPANVVGEDGTVNSQASWEMRVSKKMRKYFAYPGVILGVTCIRPKVYSSTVDGALVSRHASALHWAPGLYTGDRMRGVPGGSIWMSTTIIPTYSGTGGDHQLLLHDAYQGMDQFINHNSSSSYINSVALPNAAMSNLVYPSQAMARSVFSDTVTPSVFCYEDGIAVCSVNGNETGDVPVTF